MSNKTLYVSDLDGTLMRSDIKISDHTVKTINGLIDQGVAFTYATARSIDSAREITQDLKIKLPVITRNGSVLADNITGRSLEITVFKEEDIRMIRKLIPELPSHGFVSCYIGDKMIKTYADTEHTEGLDDYIGFYKDDPRMVKVPDMEGMFTGRPGYVTMISSKEDLEPVYERVKDHDGWESLFQKDTYRDEYWIELCPKGCTKAKKILQLKEEYGFDRVIVFGDSLNDLPMFSIADESYAVSNALDEVKAAATEVIGSNNDDAVANFIMHKEKNS